MAGSINEKVKYLKSQFDAPQTAIKSFQDNINAVRTISINNYIQDFFSRAIPTYTNGSVTRVKFYRDDTSQAETITFRNNLSEFLVGKYFIIFSGANRRKFVVLYDNANNDAVDPGIADAELIRVQLVNNDDADIVGAATKIALEATKEFKITGTNFHYEIVNIEKGFTTQIDLNNTGFVSQNVTFGVTKLLKDVPITQIPGYRYVYNELSGNFELFRTQGDIEVDFSPIIATDPEIFNVAMPIAGDEYSLALPFDTKRFQVSIRDSVCKYTINYVPGGPVVTYERGVVYTEEAIKLESTTLFVKATKPNVVMEVLVWK